MLVFAHPWLLLGLAAIVLPPIVHAWKKQATQRIFFGAFDFLQAMHAQNLHVLQLKQWLLLCLRMLLMALLVLAVARPGCQTTNPVQAATLGPRHVALVIDCSLSMSYLWHNKTLFERAREQANHLLATLPPGAEATLMPACAAVSSPQGWGPPGLVKGNQIELRAALSALSGGQLKSGGADLLAAMQTAIQPFVAAALQDHQDHAALHIDLFVLSDFSQNSSASALDVKTLPNTQVHWIDAAERSSWQALPNMAIDKVVLEPSSTTPLTRQFHVTVVNYGTADVSKRVLQLQINGQVVQRGLVDVAAHGRVTKTLVHRFTNPGQHRAQVLLLPDQNDGYTADDTYWLPVDVARGIRVLAINGEPHNVSQQDELFFVERALQATPQGDAPLALTVVSQAMWQAAANQGIYSLQNFDALLLANTTALSLEKVKSIKEFVENGGGLLISLGKQTQGAAWSDAMRSLLPRPLRDLQEGADLQTSKATFALTGFVMHHPIFMDLKAAGLASLRATHTRGFFHLETGPTSSSRALMEYDNGAPALVESMGMGRGRVLLLTTSIDDDLTDLPLHAVFPALLQQMLRYVANALAQSTSYNLNLSDKLLYSMPDNSHTLRLVDPSGQRQETLSSQRVDGVEKVWVKSMQEPGIYILEALSGLNQMVASNLVAVNVGPEESNFQPFAQALQAQGDLPAVAKNLQAATPTFANLPRAYAPQYEAMYWLLAVCLLWAAENWLASAATVRFLK